MNAFSINNNPKVESRIDFKKWIGALMVMLITSMYFFPFIFNAFPSQNTKNLLGALGIVFIFMTFVYKRSFSLTQDILVLFLFGAAVSIVAYVSITYNQTPDYSYVTFIRSMAIWFSGAYVVGAMIWMVHRRIDVELVMHYLVAVCVFQCAMTMLIQFVPAVKTFVDAHIEQGQDLLDHLGRMYGIGASLDVAGSRFSAVLVGMAVIIEKNKDTWSRISLILYILAFVVITVIGNMIARTTLVGVAIGLAYLLIMVLRSMMHRESYRQGRMIGTWLIVIALAIPLGITLYNTSKEFSEMMRFGFEGFFKFFESGEFETDSTAKLQSMIVWPEELRTWIIGDGYFENSRNDRNYLGNATVRGFYMGTDIGYLRFIFYFGVIGLIAISMVVVYSAIICIRNYPEYRNLFFLAALINFIVWLKVSTDILLFFYLFITATIVEQEFKDDEEEDTNLEELEE